jgi:hypothetical protein
LTVLAGNCSSLLIAMGCHLQRIIMMLDDGVLSLYQQLHQFQPNERLPGSRIGTLMCCADDVLTAFVQAPAYSALKAFKLCQVLHAR